MNICPLCSGSGEIPVRHIHFGDGVYKPELCNVCKGTGRVEVIPTKKSQIVIYKYHGAYCELSD